MSPSRTVKSSNSFERPVIAGAVMLIGKNLVSPLEISTSTFPEASGAPRALSAHSTWNFFVPGPSQITTICLSICSPA